ncbi:acyl-CoA synthetase, partial [Mycobacterium tuberculosis]
PFAGSPGGGGPPLLAGLLSSGAVGSFAARGLLSVRGRAAALLVSGGAPVFPAAVAGLLRGPPAVVAAAALGVAAPAFGARLRAFVVPPP